MKDSKHFNINDIDINKMRVSKAKSFMKESRSYKYYIFYEHDDKYIPLNIALVKPWLDITMNIPTKIKSVLEMFLKQSTL